MSIPLYKNDSSSNNSYYNICKFEHDSNNYIAMDLIQEIFLENETLLVDENPNKQTTSYA